MKLLIGGEFVEGQGSPLAVEEPSCCMRSRGASASARMRFIVCADVAAEIGVAARGGAWAAYLNAGQVCTSAERYYGV